MFRKTPSKLSGPSISSELKKEIRFCYVFVIRKISLLLFKYPKSVLGLMIFCMLLSLALAFTVLRKENPHGAMPGFPARSRPSGPGLRTATSALGRVLDLQHQISVILSKDTLRARDSLELRGMLGELESIQHQFNLKNKAHAD